MDFFGSVILVIIAMFVAGSLHPQGVGLVLALLIAGPFVFAGLKLMFDDGGPIGALLGLLLMLPGMALMVLFFGAL
jgi:CBS-domain-containing membrane protein